MNMRPFFAFEFSGDALFRVFLSLNIYNVINEGVAWSSLAVQDTLGLGL